MTFEQAFLKVKEKFDNADASNVADFAIQVTFSDEDCGGTFYAQVKEGKLYVEPYDYQDNNLAIKISKAALISALGRSSLDKALSKEEAEVWGDVSKFDELKSTIKTATKKATAAKKTVEKKATAAKKTVEKKATAAKKTVEKNAEEVKKAVDTAKKAEPAKAVAPAKTEAKKPAAKK